MTTAGGPVHGSARWSGEWARPTADGPAAEVDVLVPTAGRVAELATTLAGLAAQELPAFRVVVSDQSPDGAGVQDPSVQAMLRVLAAQGRAPLVLRHPERRGLAEHRQFLLDHAQARYVLFLDDDVWLEPGTVARMTDAIRRLGCGFVGSAVQGLSHLRDERPAQQTTFEPWEGPVVPEVVRRGTPGHDRWQLHNAANLAHIAARLDVPRGGWVPYRIAWVGACVLYDRALLVESGGFGFWQELPVAHAGEDVVAQWRLMERAGGAGIVPSGAVHLESPTTVVDRTVDAPDVVFADEAGPRAQHART